MHSQWIRIALMLPRGSPLHYRSGKEPFVFQSYLDTVDDHEGAKSNRHEGPKSQ